MGSYSAGVSFLRLLGGLLALSVSLRGDPGFFVYEHAEDNVFAPNHARPGPDGRFVANYAFDLEAGETFEFSVVPLPGDDANPASLGDHLRLYFATGDEAWAASDTLDWSNYSDEPKKLRFLFTTERPGQTVRFRIAFRLLTLGDARPVRRCETQHGEFVAGNVLLLRFDDPEAGCTYRFTAGCPETSLKLYAGLLEEGLVVMSDKETAWSVQEPDAPRVTVSYQPRSKQPFGLRISPENQQVGGKVQLDTEIALPFQLTHDPRNPPN